MKNLGGPTGHRHTLPDDVQQALADLTMTLSDLPLAEHLSCLEEIRLTVAFVTGERARDLADEQSWQAVAHVFGTSREAAWQRWH